MTDPGPETELAEQHAATARRIADLRRQISALAEEQALTTHDDEHDPEGVTIGYQRAQVQGLLAGARADLAAIERARDRMRDGSYGTCTRCGKPISASRLAALPATPTCIDCAGRARR